jgi:hypothetical protein
MPLVLGKFINYLTAIEERQTFGGQPIAAQSQALIIGTLNPAESGPAGKTPVSQRCWKS